MTTTETLPNGDRVQKTEVRVYRIRLFCDACTTGDLRGSGPTEEGKTLHTCAYCGAKKMVEGEPYPRTAYVPTSTR